MKLLQIDFPSQGPWGEEMSRAFAGLAGMIAGTPGLLWRIRTESSVAHEAGGIYLFTDEESLDRYLAEHTARLRSLGIEGIRARKFDAGEPFGRITRALLTAGRTARREVVC